MGIHGHDDKFTINDVTFSVPPLEIRIDKEAANFAWQTIRTRNAQKVKSGHGLINISFSAVFVGPDAINRQLRPLVAQLKLTPICYVENQFLRDSLFPENDSDSKTPTLALILKSLTITVQPELKDTIVAHFQFAWFNYKPYCADLRFKTDILIPDPQSTPENSAAWKKFYLAEMGELGGTTGIKYVPVADLNSSLSFIYSLLAIGQDDFARGTTYKKTDIKYETSNTERDGLALFVAENTVDCSPGNGLVVTGITVTFQNIVAALPVIGHQYMTYQHIGSIDPIVMVRIMATEDAARKRVAEMWKTVETNAIQFRHIPQEFLNVTISNQITRLCGLKTFITESYTEETVPGQPGTYALSLTLKGTDFPKVKESLSQEFVTSADVRDAILKVLSGKTGVSGKPYEVFPVIADRNRSALLYQYVKEYTDLVSSVGRESSGRIGSGAHALIEFSKGKDDLQVREARKIMDIVENPSSTFFKDVKKIVVAVYPLQSGNQQPKSLSSQTFPLASEDRIVNLRGLRVPTDIDVTTFSYLLNALTALNALADKITIDGTLDLPEFAEAKKLADKVGAFQGKSAYPDFPILQTIAESEGINPLDLNPDFYFHSPVTDTLEDMIDVGYIQAATAAAKRLYVNEESTGSTAGDFINVLNNHVEETYKNRFEPDGNIRKSIDESKARISSFYPEGSTRKEARSNMRRETVSGMKYNNALAEPRILRGRFSTEPLNKLPDGGEAACVSNSSIEHFGDFKAVLDQAPQTYKPSEIAALGVFTNPIGAGTVVTSKFGPRNPSNPEASKDHKGIDLRAAVGTNVLASASGIVIAAGLQDQNNDKKGHGNRVKIKHPNKYITIYAHLSELLVKTGDQISAGQVLGRSGGAGGFGSGNSTEAHLHFEVIDDSGTHIDPEKALAGSIFSRDESSGEGFQFGNSIYARSLESIHNDMLLGQGPSMKRAYPTFKLYFIEEDVEDRVFGFDDFFSYNSVKSIRVVRSRKIPADLCVIELTNISGILSNRKFQNERDRKGKLISDRPRNQAGEIIEENKDSPLLNDTAAENPIASLMLQEGAKILLKLGYDNNPDKLEDVFVGQIVEVELNDTDDLVTIVCQSYATELTQQMKGLESPEKRSGWFLGTNDAVTTRLLSEMLQQPEVLHFGRWKRSRARGVVAGILSTDRGSNTNLLLLSNKFEWNVTPQDDNIFAPLISSSQFEKFFSVQAHDNLLTSVANFMMDTVGVPPAFNLNFINYYIYKTTIWDIFKEMELRHPGCIASPVPYHDARMGPRMTMFFGMPNQLYFARDPSLKEQRRNNILQKTVLENEEEFVNEYEQMSDLHGLDKNTAAGRVNTQARGLLKILNAPFIFLAGGALLGTIVAGKQVKDGTSQIVDPLATIRTKQREVFSRHLSKTLAIADRSIRPFRSYHVLTSNNHIIENNIRTSSLDVYNTVSIEYTKKVLGFLKDETADKGVFRLKADAGIPDEEVQETFLQYPSCEGESMAEFYGLGALKQTLRDIYKGEVVIIGNPSIKPYDICYLFDEYSDMVGPVEVEQVIHYFSQDTGFITEITPDICVSINEWTTLGTMDVVGLTVENWIDLVFRRQTRRQQNPNSTLPEKGAFALGVSLPVIAGIQAATTPGLLSPTIIAGATAGGGLLAGAFVANKLVHWSKYRHPITFSPLLHKGRPFMAAMSSKTINANWWTNLVEWFKDGVDGVPLVFNDISDKLVIGAGTGKLTNLGVSTSNTSLFGGSK